MGGDVFGDSLGPPSARARRPRAPIGTLQPNAISQNFLALVERTTEAFGHGDDTAVGDVRRTLMQVRQQYDTVHHEAEAKDAKLRHLREEIRLVDMTSGQKAEETHRLDESLRLLNLQHQDTVTRQKEASTSRKVYEHMLARIQKERAILKQKLLKMEEHLQRKKREVGRKTGEGHRVLTDCVTAVREFDTLQQDAEAERESCQVALEVMDGELQRRREANKRRADFESWRHEVALEAANEAFGASAGRLRKLYAIEKLCGNCLQKVQFEQVEKSNNTEDGFQKIREVTGLADVMDIVHKFLNRDVEHEQLKTSVKDAELRLEILRQDFEAVKRDTEGVTFGGAADSALFKDVEASERELSTATEAHEVCRARLQKTTLQTEHMKRWAQRIGQSLVQHLDDQARVEGPTDLAPFFRNLDVGVERFVGTVSSQVQSGVITRKTLIQAQSREYQTQLRTITQPDFVKANCRVSAAPDGPGRPASRQGTAEDDPANSFAEDRERCKQDSVTQLRQGEKLRGLKAAAAPAARPRGAS